MHRMSRWERRREEDSSDDCNVVPFDQYSIKFSSLLHMSYQIHITFILWILVFWLSEFMNWIERNWDFWPIFYKISSLLHTRTYICIFTLLWWILFLLLRIHEIEFKEIEFFWILPDMCSQEIEIFFCSKHSLKKFRIKFAVHSIF